MLSASICNIYGQILVLSCLYEAIHCFFYQLLIFIINKKVAGFLISNIVPPAIYKYMLWNTNMLKELCSLKKYKIMESVYANNALLINKYNFFCSPHSLSLSLKKYEQNFRPISSKMLQIIREVDKTNYFDTEFLTEKATHVAINCQSWSPSIFCLNNSWPMNVESAKIELNQLHHIVTKSKTILILLLSWCWKSVYIVISGVELMCDKIRIFIYQPFHIL